MPSFVDDSDIGEYMQLSELARLHDCSPRELLQAGSQGELEIFVWFDGVQLEDYCDDYPRPQYIYTGPVPLEISDLKSIELRGGTELSKLGKVAHKRIRAGFGIAVRLGWRAGRNIRMTELIARRNDVARLSLVSRQPDCDHAPDFSTVRWYGKKYNFASGQQRGIVALLWEQWESDLGGLSKDYLHERCGGAGPSKNFRINKVFEIDGGRGGVHPAWTDGMIGPHDELKGVFCLKKPDFSQK